MTNPFKILAVARKAIIIILVLSTGCSPTLSTQSSLMDSPLAGEVDQFSTPTPEKTKTPLPSPSPIAVLEPEIPEYVPISPQDTERLIQIPADFPSIQNGIDQAADGDFILVSPGTYKENIDFKGKAITISSLAGPAETIIDGGRNGKVVEFINNESSSTMLHGFTITNGMEIGQGDPDNYSFGGGVLIQNASPIISQCWITENGANFGGGVRIEGDQSAPQLLNNKIYHNIAAERGGGIQVTGGGSPTIRGNQITDNYAMDAAGIEIVNQSSGTVQNNLISNNITGYDFSDDQLALFLNDELFFGNLGQSNMIPGGLMVTYHSYPVIVGNLITNNVGGGIGIFEESTPVIEGNAITGNQGSLADGILVGSMSAPELNGNRIEGGQSPALRFDITINSAELSPDSFVSLLSQRNSISGEIYFIHTHPKTEHEEQERRTLLVPDEFPRVQQAIEAAEPGDKIIVAPGEYQERLDFLGKPISVQSQDPDDPEVAADTILVNSNGPTVVFQNQENRQSVLSGFTIINTGQSPAVQISGDSEPLISYNIFRDNNQHSRAVHVQEAGAPHIVHNIFQNNSGGGLITIFSAPLVEDNLFTGNTAGIGGGVFATFSNPTIIDNTFQNNQSQSSGSGIQIEHYSNGLIARNTFSGNSDAFRGALSLDDFANPTVDSNKILDNQGAGVAIIFDCHPRLTNNLIAGNIGGGIFVNGSFVDIINNTLANNIKGGDDASAGESWGIFVMENSQVHVINTILSQSKIVLYDPYSSVDISYSLIHDTERITEEGPGILQANPLFIDQSDFKLSPESPGLDAGIAVDLKHDLIGNPRPAGSGFDLGSYEYSNPPAQEATPEY